MRRLKFILLVQLSNIFAFGQATKEQAFIATVKEIVSAFSRQDSATVAKFVDKKTGLYQLDRVGVFDNYNHLTKVSFSDTTYPQIMFKYAKGIQLLPLKYAKLPTWNCDNEVWSKKGLYVDTTKTDHPLSRISKDRNKYRSDNIPLKKIQYFTSLEKKSRRIILVDHSQKELVFYLTYLDRKWFLTIIDNVSSDCSV